ncbi:MAG: MXAN_6640 family putative metalloprotease, partial [Cyclonatronaceae bacterium]
APGKEAAQHVPWNVWADEAKKSAAHAHSLKCLTSFLANSEGIKNIHQQLQKTKALEYLHEHYSPSGFFLIRYDTEGQHAVPPADENGSGVPDRVELVAAAAEQAAAFYTTELGYRSPLGNQQAYVIYLRDLDFYGFTTEDENGGLYTLIDSRFDFIPEDANDAENPAEGAAQITVAHELFHAVQYRYNAWNGPSGATAWLEMDAVTAENQAFPDINDYLNFLDADSIFRRPSQSTPVAYAHATWLMFFTEAFSPDILRHVWQRIAQQPDLPYETALRQEVEARGQEFRHALTHLHLWHFASGSGARSGFGFPDAGRYPDSFKNTERITLPDEAFSLRSIAPLAANYYIISPENPPDAEILTAFFADAPETGLGLLAYFEDGSIDTQLVDPPENETAPSAAPQPQLTATGWNWEEIEHLGIVVINAGFEEEGSRLHQLLAGQNAPAGEAGSIEQILYGDALQNGVVSEGDAAALLQHSSAESYGELGLAGRYAAEVSANAGLTAYDAGLIFRRASGFMEAFPADANQSGFGPDISDFGTSKFGETAGIRAASQAEIQLSLEHEAFYQGEEVDVELWVSGLPAAALSAGLEFYYPPGLIEFSGLGSGDEQFSEVIYRYDEPEPGRIRLAWATNEWSGDGMIGRLRFQIMQSGSAELIPVSLLLNEWEAGAGYDYTLEAAAFEVDPQPPVSAPTVDSRPEAPGRVRLLPNYPNPFNAQTTLAFELPAAASVQLQLFDITGRPVARLLSGDTFGPGVHTVSWNAKNAASGIYIARLLVRPRPGGATLRLSQRISLVK